MLDCTKPFNNYGCKGGQPINVYKYIVQNGINITENYPYTGKDKKCLAPTKKEVFKGLKGFIEPEKNVISLLQLLQYGPVVVNHYVPDDFKYYSRGVFDSPDCHHSTVINHSSVIVGYDFTGKEATFLLKNSWGKKWGEDGMYKVKIGPLNYTNPGFCYLASNGFNTFPIV